MGLVVKMPKLGLEMDEGVLLEWVVESGETVAAGDVLAEVESEKSVGEVEAREDGVLRRVYLDEGEAVPPGEPIAILAAADADITDLESEVEAESAGELSDVAAEPATEESPAVEESTTGGTSAVSAVTKVESSPDDPGNVKASPRAKKRAEELGVDLAAVTGTGPGGAITADDVETAPTTDEPTTAADTAESDIVEERELSGMRRTIADRLGESYREAVHVTVHRDVRIDEFLDATAIADGALDTDISVNDTLLVALSATLADHPAFNATFEDEVHRIHAPQNVGVAVDLDDGLVTPVLDDIAGDSLSELAERRREATERVLAGEFTMADLSNGTFTVTNLGVFGVDSFDPVINPPQVAILGIDRIRERPVVEDGEVTVGSWMGFDLSFDHRIVDGADAARFLDTFAGELTNPWPSLFDRV